MQKRLTIGKTGRGVNIFFAHRSDTLSLKENIINSEAPSALTLEASNHQKLGWEPSMPKEIYVPNEQKSNS